MASAAMLMAAVPEPAGAAAEVFTATATVKTADGKSATAPMTITIDRTMPESEAAPLVAAFKSGGAAALRKALVGVAPTGSVRVGKGKAASARFTVERATGGGRLLTIVTDQPLVFIGANAPGAKPKAGYDFAVIDLQIDAAGAGSGTVSPAATLKLNGDAFVVEDYSGEVVRLTGVKKGS
jgi:hypothetical protein